VTTTHTGQTSSQKVIHAAGGLLWRKAADGYNIALVYRPRYDDWSLPKGKLHSGETWLQAALREVKEETGYSVEVLGFAGALSYPTEKGPKIVCFWHMLPAGEADWQAGDEISQVTWRPFTQALEKLTYPLEKALLQLWRAPGELHPNTPS
jgi:ADP-ribose pyrophosphatase YjhB (NUDIX family)